MAFEANKFSTISLSTLEDKSFFIGIAETNTLQFYKQRHHPPLELIKKVKLLQKIYC